MILIKLGGSIITNKARPLSSRRRAISKIAKNLKEISEPMILVHGGGSYGHYWSVKYDMHTKPQKYDLMGVTVVKNSMVELNMTILKILAANKINSYCLPPTFFMRGNKPEIKKIREVGEIAESNLTPITFGDAVWYGHGMTYILSGDKIMTHMARILKPRLCVFALNEDGVYKDLDSKELITEFKGAKPATIQSKMDVTGGMSRKIEEACQIAKSGTDVFMVNGNKSERIIKAVKNNEFYGTVFRGRRHA